MGPLPRSPRYAWRFAAYSTTCSPPPPHGDPWCSPRQRRRRLHGAGLRARLRSARAGVRAGAVTVDHGLQAGSAARALDVADRLRDLGLDPVEAVGVTVGGRARRPGGRRPGRPVRALRRHRRRPLGAAAVLLGHTRDDQAETVLLGLARGSGTRSLSGMAAVSGPGGRYRRPFLLLDRDTPASLPGAGHRRLGGPAQRRPRLHPGPGPARGAAGAGEVARPRRRRLAGPHRPAVPRRRRRPRPVGRRRAGRRGGRPTAPGRRPAAAAAARRAAPGAAPGGGRRRLARRARCSPGTSRRPTGWSPTGAGRDRSICPGGVAARRADGRLVFGARPRPTTE